MKKILFFLFTLFISVSAYSQSFGKGIVSILSGTTLVFPWQIQLGSSMTLVDNGDGTATINATAGGLGGGAPTNATYIVQTANAELSGEQALSALSTGLMKVTNGTGVVSSITDNSSNWDTAYTDRLKWDGGATGLVAATGRTSLGLDIGVNVQAYDADLTTYAGITPSANAQTLLAQTFAQMQASLSVDDLITLSGVSEGAVNLGTFTGSTITDNQTIKASLQLLETAVETKQASDADLTTIAGLSVAQGKIIIGSAAPAWSVSAYKLPIVACAENQIPKANASGDFVCAADATGGSPTFDQIGSGSNTAATMTVGTGATLLVNGGVFSLGADPADAGAIRLSNAQYIYSEADAAGTDISVIGVDSSEVVQIGASGASGVTVTPDTTITGDITVNGSDVTVGSAGVKLTGDGDGALTLLGLGNGSDEDLTLNLDDTANEVLVSSSTGANLSLGLNLLLNEKQIVLDSALSADGTYSGITVAGTAGATLAFGDLVYLAAADSRWELADADAASTSGDIVLGICVLAAANDGDATTILLYGKVRADTAFPALTIGAPAYVGTTAGDIQTAQPSGTDDVIRRVGFAVTADELMFAPSNDYATHT